MVRFNAEDLCAIVVWFIFPGSHPISSFHLLVSDLETESYFAPPSATPLLNILRLAPDTKGGKRRILYLPVSVS